MKGHCFLFTVCCFTFRNGIWPSRDFNNWGILISHFCCVSFSNIRTLKLKAQLTNVFFCYHQSNVWLLLQASKYCRMPQSTKHNEYSLFSKCNSSESWKLHVQMQKQGFLKQHLNEDLVFIFFCYSQHTLILHDFHGISIICILAIFSHCGLLY